jgi:hypothetical protein
LPLVRKFFPLDKNYLLEEAQLSLQDALLSRLIDLVKSEFERRTNPLGLMDGFSLKIKNYQSQNLKPLYNFYQNLAGVYRFKYSDNQLEFVWDGRDHREKYKAEWMATFVEWATEFCEQELFVQAVLDLTVFLPENRHAHLAENRMNNFMLRQFDVKIHRTKGLVAMKVA